MKNEIDWTLARKNINPKTKQPFKRGLRDARDNGPGPCCR